MLILLHLQHITNRIRLLEKLTAGGQTDNSERNTLGANVLRDDRCPGGMHWFAMRATYGRNVTAQRLLSDAGISETFIPMKREGRRIRRESSASNTRPPVMSPAVKDLIFVRARRAEIQTVKHSIPFLHYIMVKSKTTADGAAEPLTVPERQMRPFIDANTPDGDDLEWLSPADLKPGQHFSILEGPFRGLEATLQRLPGRRARSVIVSIEGLIAAAINLPIEYLAKIPSTNQ